MKKKDMETVAQRLREVAPYPKCAGAESVLRYWIMHRDGMVLVVKDNPKVVVALTANPMTQFWFDAYGKE